MIPVSCKNADAPYLTFQDFLLESAVYFEKASALLQ